jgi:hypothetical protein
MGQPRWTMDGQRPASSIVCWTDCDQIRLVGTGLHFGRELTGEALEPSMIRSSDSRRRSARV